MFLKPSPEGLDGIEVKLDLIETLNREKRTCDQLPHAWPFPIVLGFHDEVIDEFFFTSPACTAHSLIEKYSSVLRLIRGGRASHDYLVAFWITPEGYVSVFGDA